MVFPEKTYITPLPPHNGHLELYLKPLSSDPKVAVLDEFDCIWIETIFQSSIGKWIFTRKAKVLMILLRWLISAMQKLWFFIVLASF